MIAKPVWVVLRPVSKTKLVAKAAYFSKGAARNACVPNYADGIKEAVLLLDVPESLSHAGDKHAARGIMVTTCAWNKRAMLDGDCCNLPSAAKKGVKRGKK